MIKALERGYVQQEIQNAAYEYQQQVDREEAVVVGVNRFAVDEEKPIPIQRIDESLERKQVERLRALRARRDPGSLERLPAEDRRRGPLRRKSDASNPDRGRSQRHGRRNLRHHAKSVWRVQRSRGYLTPL